MNKGELVGKIAKTAGITKKQASAALDTFISHTKYGLRKDGRVALTGFGTFIVSERKARTGRNPQTGEKIKIKASKAVRFKAGKDIKKKI
jgi:DNA-binding protein HU-beta